MNPYTPDNSIDQRVNLSIEPDLVNELIEIHTHSFRYNLIRLHHHGVIRVWEVLEHVS